MLYSYLLITHVMCHMIISVKHNNLKTHILYYDSCHPLVIWNGYHYNVFQYFMVFLTNNINLLNIVK